MDTEMTFEMAMRLLFGDKADHIASEHQSVRERRAWLIKATRLLTRVVDGLDTTPRHKELLMAELQEFAELIKRERNVSWGLVYVLLQLASRLIGYDYVDGVQLHTPTYWQTPSQHWRSVVSAGGDAMDDHRLKKNAIAVRRTVVEDLRSKGIDDFTIAVVLNTTEYKIKQLSAAPRASRKAVRTS